MASLSWAFVVVVASRVEGVPQVLDPGGRRVVRHLLGAEVEVGDQLVAGFRRDGLQGSDHLAGGVHRELLATRHAPQDLLVALLEPRLAVPVALLVAATLRRLELRGVDRPDAAQRQGCRVRRRARPGDLDLRVAPFGHRLGGHPGEVGGVLLQVEHGGKGYLREDGHGPEGAGAGISRRRSGPGPGLAEQGGQAADHRWVLLAGDPRQDHLLDGGVGDEGVTGAVEDEPARRDDRDHPDLIGDDGATS